MNGTATSGSVDGNCSVANFSMSSVTCLFIPPISLTRPSLSNINITYGGLQQTTLVAQLQLTYAVNVSNIISMYSAHDGVEQDEDTNIVLANITANENGRFGIYFNLNNIGTILVQNATTSSNAYDGCYLASGVKFEIVRTKMKNYLRF